eukprot:352013-Pyramimonas_sp.AAC.1
MPEHCVPGVADGPLHRPRLDPCREPLLDGLARELACGVGGARLEVQQRCEASPLEARAQRISEPSPEEGQLRAKHSVELVS